jgi:hypothetical protein
MDVAQTPTPVLIFAWIGLYIVIWAVMAVASYASIRLANRFTRPKKENP